MKKYIRSNSNSERVKYIVSFNIRSKINLGDLMSTIDKMGGPFYVPVYDKTAGKWALVVQNKDCDALEDILHSYGVNYYTESV